MAKRLKLTGRVTVGVKGVNTELGAGTEVTEIALPDKEYGLSAKDVESIVNGGCGVIVDDAPVITAPAITDDRLEELQDAISELDHENDAHFTESGLPEVAALKEITQSKVTAAERDAAWKAYNA